MTTNLVTIAKLPIDNPPTLEGLSSYDLTPIDHDYAGGFAKRANYVFAQLGLPTRMAMVIGNPSDAEAIYESFRTDEKYLGGGTGSGFKQVALKYMDRLDPLAEKIGSVNVVAKRNGQLIGHNTDGSGFVLGLETLLQETDVTSLEDMQILLLGAGGTADAIAIALAEKRVANIAIVNRTVEKARALAEKVTKATSVPATGVGEDVLIDHIASADVIINASTKSAEGPFADYAAFAPAVPDQLQANVAASTEMIARAKKSAIVCDINLRQDESPTLRIAREANLQVQDGVPMNIYQAVEALWIMHGELFAQMNIHKNRIAELVTAA